MGETPDDDINALRPGYELGRYLIERTLGVGGFGITYLARHRYLQRKFVAIKEYLPESRAYRDGRSRVCIKSERHRDDFDYGLQRFRQEANHLQQVTEETHPAVSNIVGVQDVFLANDTAYIVMDYVEGDSLERVIERLQRTGKVESESRIRDLFEQLARAVAFIHERHIWHRDITPSNVIVRRTDNRPVLIDFGSARAEVAKTIMTRGTNSQGTRIIFTPGYAPLEQCDGMDQQDARADIYSLAATMYHLTLRRKPLPSPQRRGTIDDGNSDPLISAVTLGERDGYSPELLETIDRGLGLRPADRPDSIAAWVKPLGFDLSGTRRAERPAPSPPEPPIPGLPTIEKWYRWAKTGRRRIYLAAGALTLLALVFVWILAPPNTDRLFDRAEDLLADAPFEDRNLDGALERFLKIRLALQPGMEMHDRAEAGSRAVGLLRGFRAAVRTGELDQAQITLGQFLQQADRADFEASIVTQVEDRYRLESSLSGMAELLNMTSLEEALDTRGQELLTAMSPAGDGDPRVEAAKEALDAAVSAGRNMRGARFAQAFADLDRVQAHGDDIGYADVEAANAKYALTQYIQFYVRNLHSDALGDLVRNAADEAVLKSARSGFDEIVRVDATFTPGVAALRLIDGLTGAVEAIRGGGVDEVEGTLAELSASAVEAGINPSEWNTMLGSFRTAIVKRRLQLAAEALADAPLAQDSQDRAESQWEAVIDESRDFGLDESYAQAASSGQSGLVVLRSIRSHVQNAAFLRAESALSDGAKIVAAMVEGPRIADSAGQALDAARRAEVDARAAALLAAIGDYRLPDATTAIRDAAQRIFDIASAEPRAVAATELSDSLDRLSASVNQGDYPRAYAQWNTVTAKLDQLGVGDAVRAENKQWLDESTFAASKERLAGAFDELVQSPLDAMVIDSIRAATEGAAELARTAGKTNEDANLLGNVIPILADIRSAVDDADFVAARKRIEEVARGLEPSALPAAELQAALGSRVDDAQSTITRDTRHRVDSVLARGVRSLRSAPLDLSTVDGLESELTAFADVRRSFAQQGIDAFDWSGVDEADSVCNALRTALRQARSNTDYVVATQTLLELELGLPEGSAWMPVAAKAREELDAEWRTRIDEGLAAAAEALAQRPLSAAAFDSAASSYAAVRALEKSSDGRGALGERFVSVLRPYWVAYDEDQVRFLLGQAGELRNDTEDFAPLPGARAVVDYLDTEISKKVARLLEESRERVDAVLAGLTDSPDDSELVALAGDLQTLRRDLGDQGMEAAALFADASARTLQHLIDAHKEYARRYYYTALARIEDFRAAPNLQDLATPSRRRLQSAAKELEEEIENAAYSPRSSLIFDLQTAFEPLATDPLDRETWSTIDRTVDGILEQQPDFPIALAAKSLAEAVRSSVGGQSLRAEDCKRVGTVLAKDDAGTTEFLRLVNDAASVRKLYRSSCATAAAN